MLWLLALAALAQESPKVLFDRAAKALAAGDYAAAETGFQRVLTAEPSNLGALGNLGVVYSRTERFDQAINVYQRALRLRPAAAPLHLNLGLAYFKQERYADALEQLRAVDAEQARELAATCLVELRRSEEALSALDALVETPSRLYLRSVALLQSKQPGAARQAMARMAESLNDPARADFLLGRAYYQSERFEQARERFDAVLKRDPSFEGAARELGKTCISQRDDACAEKQLRAALQADHRDVEAQYYLGSLLAQQQRFDEALPLLEKSRVERPGFWAPYYYLGKAKLLQGQNAEGIHLLEKAVELNPEESSAWYQLGLALQSSGRAEEARRAMDRVRRLKRQ